MNCVWPFSTYSHTTKSHLLSQEKAANFDFCPLLLRLCADIKTCRKKNKITIDVTTTYQELVGNGINLIKKYSCSICQKRKEKKSILVYFLGVVQSPRISWNLIPFLNVKFHLPFYFIGAFCHLAILISGKKKFSLNFRNFFSIHQ